MHYKGTLSNGEVFDSSEGKEPLDFIYGEGQIIPGLESELQGMKVGEKKKIEKISPDKAYGPYMDEARQEVPKSQLPQDVELKEGMQLAAQGPQGVIPVTIKELHEDKAVIDFNHPLAGQELTFEVEITNVRDPTTDELEHGHSHGPGGHDHSEEPSK